MSGLAVGRVVHYVSYGTPNGEYPSVCRAAIITSTSLEDPTLDGDDVNLCVINPEGFFFNKNVRFNDDPRPRGGTWHWPEYR